MAESRNGKNYKEKHSMKLTMEIPYKERNSKCFINKTKQQAKSK